MTRDGNKGLPQLHNTNPLCTVRALSFWIRPNFCHKIGQKDPTLPKKMRRYLFVFILVDANFYENMDDKATMAMKKTYLVMVSIFRVSSW